MAAIGLALIRLDESFGEDQGLDLPGIGLVTGGALGLVWGLVRGNAVGWGSREVIAALMAGVVLLLGFAAWERRAREPMLPMSFFHSRAFSAAVAASFLLFAALYGSVFFMAQFMQTALGYEPFEAGLMLIPWTATLLVIAPVAGALGDRIGERPLVVGGLAINAVGLAAIALIADPDLSYWQLLPALLVAGVGASAAIPVVQTALIGAVDESAVGKASGANNMSQELGGAFGVAILVAVFSAAGGYASAQALSEGFVSALAACAALALLGAAASLALPKRRRRIEPDPQWGAPAK